ncbi:MAG: hypothetical protein LH480_06620 [Rubrivivax sp.]|nr:hypothetical protein [Rubrivivax sp.]
MSDPVPDSLEPRPRHAEPLQPDAPWAGGDDASGSATREETGVSSDAPAATPTAAGAADPALQKRTDRRQTEQTDQALRNVRDGYK